MIVAEGDARSYCARFVDQAALDRLDAFRVALVEENTRQNLIAKGSLESIWSRHIADSLQLLAYVPRETSLPLLDLGTGAGFPGLALAIARPDIPVILVESRKKRIDWLKANVDRFGLQNCSVKGARLENVETVPVAVITARAFAPLGKLLDLSARFSTPDTVWLLPKGRSAAQELKEQPNMLRNMFHVEQSITDPEAKILVGKGVPQTSSAR